MEKYLYLYIEDNDLRREIFTKIEEFKTKNP
jgi:hypothetical protein